jgi:hypothetical protein
MPPLDTVWVETDYFEDDINYQYWMALYHSVLMLTGNDIMPIGTFQVAFTAIFVTIGAIINANLFGQLAVIFSSINRKATLFQEKFDITTTAMKNLNLPEKLQVKVTAFLAYTQRLLESQRELTTFLDMISPSLKEEVIKHIFAETLKNNAILKDNEDLIYFLTKKLKTEIHMPEDEIITQGQKGTRLYFMARGE